MLQKFETQIVDITEIKCSYLEGDENSLMPVRNSIENFCRFNFFDKRFIRKPKSTKH